MDSQMHDHDMAQDDSTDTDAAETPDGYELIGTAALRRKQRKTRTDQYVMSITKAARAAGIEDGDQIHFTAGIEDGERMLVAGIADDGADTKAYTDGASLRLRIPQLVLDEDLGIDIDSYDPDAAPKFRLYAGDGTIFFDPIDETVPYQSRTDDTESDDTQRQRQRRPVVTVHDMQFQPDMAAALVTVMVDDAVREYEVFYLYDPERVEAESHGGHPTDREAVLAIHAGVTAMSHRDADVQLPEWVAVDDSTYQFTYGHAVEHDYILEAAHVSGVDPDRLARLAFEAEAAIVETGLLADATDVLHINSHKLVGVDEDWWQSTLRQTLDMDLQQAEVNALARAHRLQAQALVDADAEDFDAVVALPSRPDHA